MTLFISLCLVVVLTFAVVYFAVRLEITERCMQYYGWEYYAIFPEPMCHVELQVQPLEYLDEIFKDLPKPTTTQDA